MGYKISIIHCIPRCLTVIPLNVCGRVVWVCKRDWKYPEQLVKCKAPYTPSGHKKPIVKHLKIRPNVLAFVFMRNRNFRFGKTFIKVIYLFNLFRLNLKKNGSRPLPVCAQNNVHHVWLIINFWSFWLISPLFWLCGLVCYGSACGGQFGAICEFYF